MSCHAPDRRDDRPFHWSLSTIIRFSSADRRSSGRLWLRYRARLRVGEVGFDPKTDRERRLKNKAVGEMAKNTGRNLMYYADLLEKHPLVEDAPMAMQPSRPAPMP
jgi:hypothetical protein